MKTKRLFIGTPVNKDIFEYILPEIKEEFTNMVKGKWVELHNLHFTYKFLGDVEISKIDKIKIQIAKELNNYNSELLFNNLDAFPNTNKPRVIFAKIFNPDKKIFQIKNNIENKLSQIGFEKESKRFVPHLTLCRVKYVDTNPENIFDDYQISFGKMNSFGVYLYESILTQKGPVYKKL